MRNKWFLLVLTGLILAGCGDKPLEPVKPGGKTEPETPVEPETPEADPTAAGKGEVLPAWAEGWLDIHSINGGRGESFYYIFPDGTTMLIDAAGAPPHELAVTADPTNGGTPSRPSADISCGQVIVNYIKHFAPEVAGGKIDYFMASHYHGDHIGAWRDSWQTLYKWPLHPMGGFVVNGLPDVGTQIPIVKIIDRGDWGDAGGRCSADYIDSGGKKRYQNYMKFVEWTKSANGTVRETLEVGRNDQIVMLHHPEKYTNFSIRNVASGGDIWTGSGTGVNTTYVPSAAECKAHCAEWSISENIYSIAVWLNYGPFDYFTGGDIQYSGKSSHSWKDIEKPIAAAVAKKMEVMKASHHCTANTNSPELTATFKPDVVIAATWQDVQPNPATVKRFQSANSNVKLFATNMADSNLKTLADAGVPSTAFSCLGGHVVVRVAPNTGKYWVFVLDDTNENYIIKDKFGPYVSQ
jgi:beta-lactamase superfamily II metal-dependent hydrolase